MNRIFNPLHLVPRIAGSQRTPAKPHEFLSLVVPVCDRPERLAELHALLRQRASKLADRWEIIFVDYGSTSRQWLASRQLKAEGADDIRCYRLVNQRDRREALNFGHAAAKGDTVLRIDVLWPTGPTPLSPRVRMRPSAVHLRRSPQKTRSWVPCGGKSNILYLPGTASEPAA